MGHTYNIFDAALAGAINAEPDIKLSEAAMIDNSNVLIEDGEVQTSPLRLLEGVDNNDNQIKIPDQSFVIISVTEATDTIVFEGDGSGIVETDTIYLMNNHDGGGNYNDGTYTVSTIDESGGNTTITTVSSIDNDSITGFLFFGEGVTLKIRALLLDDGSEEIFFFTRNCIYQYKLAGLFLAKLVLPYTLGSDVLHWSVDQGLVNFGTTGTPDQEQGLIACNGLEEPLRIKSNGIITILNAVTGGGTINAAKHCVFYENYLLLGNVVVDGDDSPTWFYNSDLLDTANFSTNDSSFFITEGSDALTGFGKEKDNLIIFKSESIIQVYFTATDDIFQLNRISTPIGCTAPDSIINDRNNFLYFFGTDKRFKILRTGGDISNVIEKSLRNVKDSLISGIRGIYIRDDDRLIWSIPEGANAINNNRLVIIKEGVWSFLDIEVSAFSVFRKVFTDTWDTLEVAVTWDNVFGAWNTVQGQEGNLNILGTDFNGNISTMFSSYEDQGELYESYVTVSTDLNKKKALNTYKRITKIRFYFIPITSEDSIDLEVSRDNNITYDEISTFSAYDPDKDMNIITKTMSLRGKSFRFRIKSIDRFNLIGLIIYFETMGDR